MGNKQKNTIFTKETGRKKNTNDMSLTHTDTPISNLVINRFETQAEYETAQQQGLIGQDDISIIDENIQADWNQSNTTAPDYIKNKPTIPTVNDATLTIQKNGTTVDTFTANASTNKTVNITVPTTLSALTDTTITTPSNGQVLTYDNTTSKWMNANAEKEIFWCTMTSTTENNTTTWSCDKTWSEIYAAHQAGKLVYLKKAQNDEILTPYRILSNSGFFSQCIVIPVFNENFFVVDTFNYDTNDGWTYTMSNALPIDTLSFFPILDGTAGQVLTVSSGGNSMEWLDVPTELPSITGNAGKVLTVNSGATGTEWTTPSSGATTLSALTDTTISSPTDNQILKYNNSTSKWINSDIPTEVFLCTFTTTIDYENNNAVTFSCDKTPAEIYTAYEAGKCVIMNTAGDYSDEVSVPENNMIFRLEFAKYFDTNPEKYNLFFKINTDPFGELFSLIAPILNADINQIWSISISYISGLYDFYGITDGWYFYRNSLMIANYGQGSLNGKLAEFSSTSELSDSGLTASAVSTAVTNSHTHSNKTILDYIPSTLGTAGQALVVNNNATGLTFATVGGGGGGLTNYDFTHVANTTVSTSTTTITFAANQRGSQMITVSANVNVILAVNNLSDNYLWVKNSGSSAIDVTIAAISNSTLGTITNMYLPADGISVEGGKVCEMGIVVNTDGAFITCRNDLELTTLS